MRKLYWEIATTVVEIILNMCLAAWLMLIIFWGITYLIPLEK